MASFTLSSTSSVARTLLNGETGFIGVNGALSIPIGSAVDGSGSIRLTVLGAIQAFSGQAVDHDGTTLVMDIGAAGYVGSSSADAINANVTSSATVTNFGAVRAIADGLDLRASDPAATIRVVNHGEISGQSDGMVLLSGTGTTTIINTGIISGEEFGIFNAFSGQGGNTRVLNSGTIQGIDVGYGGDDSIETIRNAGTIIGGIDLDGGNDVYRGGGGKVIGEVTGEDGEDTLLGGAYKDVFSGGNGKDELRGRGGEDELNGNGGNDKVFGGTGNDQVLGGIGADVIRGGAGDDILGGGDGNDTIHGGSGDDDMTGGKGADVFVLKPNAGNDVIKDFKNGVDKIDLSGFGLRPADFGSVVNPALSNAGGATRLDLDAIGGDGTLLIDGLAFGDAGASDFIL